MDIKKQLLFVLAVVAIFVGMSTINTSADHYEYESPYEYETPYDYETPPYGDPGYGDPGYGDPGYGDPGYGDPGYGDPGYGDPGYGDPGYGDPGYGDPGYGTPTYGTPYLTPAYGDPGYVYPTPGEKLKAGEYECFSDNDCQPNSPGGVATCCQAPDGGSRMCASDGGGPYCYNYQFQYPAPAYAYEYPSPAPGYLYPAPYGTPVSGMTGTLTPGAASCIINSGQSFCNIGFSWSVNNPEATSAITKPVNVTVATGNSGTGVPFAVKFNSETFFHYNNAKLLDQETVTSSCESGTAWNGTICVEGDGSWSAWGPWSACINGQQSRTRTCTTGSCSGSNIEFRACGGTCPEPAISANPQIISPGGASELSWCSPASSVCTGASAPTDSDWNSAKAASGTQSVTPAVTTTYMLTCSGQSAQTTVIVRFQPWFVED